MDYIDAIKARALLAVLKPDDEAILRRVFRWYSREFSTPLHLVKALPLEDVMTHYFECIFEDMEDIEVQDLISQLVETKEEREIRKSQETQLASKDDEFLAKAREDFAKDRVKRNKQAVEVAEPQEVQVDPPGTTDVPPAEPPPLPEPEEISIKFDDNLSPETVAKLQRFLLADPLGAPPPGKKK